jgi:hypothetical protein
MTAVKCVHKGCGKVFTEPSEEECVYHPGPPIFHEGQKGIFSPPKPVQPNSPYSLHFQSTCIHTRTPIKAPPTPKKLTPRSQVGDAANPASSRLTSFYPSRLVQKGDTLRLKMHHLLSPRLPRRQMMGNQLQTVHQQQHLHPGSPSINPKFSNNNTPPNPRPPPPQSTRAILSSTKAVRATHAVSDASSNSTSSFVSKAARPKIATFSSDQGRRNAGMTLP